VKCRRLGVDVTLFLKVIQMYNVAAPSSSPAALYFSLDFRNGTFPLNGRLTFFFFFFSPFERKKRSTVLKKRKKCYTSIG
jgi:hypothetical protein